MNSREPSVYLDAGVCVAERAVGAVPGQVHHLWWDEGCFPGGNYDMREVGRLIPSLAIR